MDPVDTKAARVPGWPWPVAWTHPWPGVALPWAGLAPQRLEQPINPGWSFGNITVTQLNSSSPEVEGAILARHSYGRQIGRMMEALSALVEAEPWLASDRRIGAFRQMASDVADIKAEARKARLERLGEELRALREHDPQAWAALLKGLET